MHALPGRSVLRGHSVARCWLSARLRRDDPKAFAAMSVPDPTLESEHVSNSRETHGEPLLNPTGPSENRMRVVALQGNVTTL